jgi:hypothetical protein
MNPTTRKFCRSTAEAFAAERYNTITIYKAKSRIWRRVFLVLLLLLALFSLSAHAGQWTLLAGVAKVGVPDDGTYWNRDKLHTINLTTAPVGIRYDTKQRSGWSVGVQGMYFGMTNIDGLASTRDWKEVGGYNPSIGHCNGPCAPLATWKMQSETSSVAFILNKQWGNWFTGLGATAYEIKTSGYVLYGDGSTYHYPSARYLDFNGMAEFGYKKDNLSIRFQIMPMEGRGAVPSVSVGTTYALVGGYTF